MSSVTFGAKTPLVCSTDTLEGLLPDAPFALVEVPKFSTSDDFLEICRCRLGAAQGCRKMSVQCRLQPLAFPGIHRAEDRVCSETGDLSADITDRGVHRIRERFSGVTANDKGALLCHKASHIAAIPGNNDFATFHRDAEPSSGVAVNHYGSVTKSCCRTAACVAVNPDCPAQHGFRKPPSSTTLNFNRSSITQTTTVISRATRNANANLV